MTNLVLLDLLGGVALLLWGLHMVQTGILRAFGADIRRLLSVSLAQRFKAFLAGAGVTAVLQSSTATALMVSGFAAEGMVGLVPALAILLGANVGTTLVVQVLSFNVSAAAPILLAGGVLAFKRGKRTLTRDLGRVAIGLGLMLLSLHILLKSLAPAESAPLAREILAAATGQPLVNLALGTLLAWAAHSSVAVVLLTMSLGYSHFVTPAAALALILGANLGSAINPVLEGGAAGNRAALRVSLGNLLNRAVGCALVLPFIAPVSEALARLDPSPLRAGADFHTLFNLGLAMLFIMPLGALARLLERLLPDEKGPPDPAAPAYLDDAALTSPPLALASAAREALRMGDMVQGMLDRSMTALMTDDRNLVGEVSRDDDVIDRLHEAIKLYVVGVTREELEDREARRAMEVIAFVINMEHIGDIIDKNLMELAAKKIKHRLSFSEEGAAELKAIHEHVLRDLRLAFGIFVSGDVKVARQLLEEKARFREAEVAASESHLARLREGRPESIETSALHLDILRDLKRIHSHICAIAYPVLEAAGGRRAAGARAATKNAVPPRSAGEPRLR
ncbi:MAG TPA: Na/Pi cotransporter family protein [Burkholderiales bacterium]|nr:Na/Pi cotransporter family protein [Burkholderiales bacterium]